MHLCKYCRNIDIDITFCLQNTDHTDKEWTMLTRSEYLISIDRIQSTAREYK